MRCYHGEMPRPCWEKVAGPCEEFQASPSLVPAKYETSVFPTNNLIIQCLVEEEFRAAGSGV